MRARRVAEPRSQDGFSNGGFSNRRLSVKFTPMATNRRTAMIGACEIRPLAAKDRAPWQPLWRGYQDFYQVDIPDEVSAVTWSRLLDPAEPMCGALAWTEDGAAGLVHFIRHRSCWTAGDYCYLQDLFIAEDARGTGIGRKLIEHVYAEATLWGCSRVYWLTHETNLAAMQLYDRIAERPGFIQYRRTLPVVTLETQT
jgi:GNAT superfamily N-acetyltransferase